MRLANDLTELLNKYGPSMAKAIHEVLPPRHQADDPLPDLKPLEKHRSRMSKRRFNFFPSQMNTIAGALAGLNSDRSGWIISEMGTGKAQPLDAKVLTPSGWKTMGSLRAGDDVIDPDGGIAKVTGVFPQGMKPVFKVVMSDGSSTECCDEHLWNVQSPLRKWRGQSSTVKSLSEIRKSLSHKNGNRQHFIPMVTPVEFCEKESLPLDPYLLGVLLGDGGISQQSIRITTADAELVSIVQSLLPEGHTLKKEGRPYDYVIKCGGRQKKHVVRLALHELGLWRTKSATKFIPAQYLWGSLHTRLSVLQGLFDTDGHATGHAGSRQSIYTNAIEYSTASKLLAENVIELVRSMGGTASMCERKTHYIKDGKRIEASISHRLYIVMPSHLQVFRLARKYSWYRGGQKYKPNRSIARVIPVGEKQCQCIMVNSKRHLYVTDDYIVTHNTVMALATAWAKLHRRKNPMRLLIMSPGHLTKKWQREVQWLIPNVECHVIQRFPDLVAFQERERVSTNPMVAVIGKDTAKLGFDYDKPCASSRLVTLRMVTSEPRNSDRIVGQEIDRWGYSSGRKIILRTLKAASCPRCGAVLKTGSDDEPCYIELDEYIRRDEPLRCASCGDLLRTNARGHRSNPHIDRYIQRKMRGVFDLLIADEVHELSGSQTCQGNALGTLGAACRYVLALTGTLIGGKAADLHAPLWRLCPQLMKARGFNLRPFAHSRISPIARNERAFVRTYGVMEHQITRNMSDDYGGRVYRGRAGRRKQHKTEERVRPGISPDLFNHFLIGNAVFMSLTELGPALPTLERILVPCHMSSELRTAYDRIDEAIQSAMKAKRFTGNGPPVLATIRIQALDAYLDKPWGWEPITAPVYDEDGGRVGDEVVCTPDDLGELHEDSKDQELLKIIQSELKQGRKCAIYVQFTGKHDVRPKLVAMLKDAGIRGLALPDSVAPANREEWIEKNANKMDVLICHPKRVMTGLDLVGFPSLIWYQVGYSTHVLRQASARARRPIQTLPCKVFFLYYKGTIQDQALGLMGEKEAASQALEGTFDTNALRAMMNGGKDDDLMSSLAHSLERNVDATAAWAKIKDQAQPNFRRVPTTRTVARPTPSQDLLPWDDARRAVQVTDAADDGVAVLFA